MASQWYYIKAEQKLGPVSSNELRSLAKTGELEPNCLIWKDGLDNWIPARKLKGLFSKPVNHGTSPPKSMAPVPKEPPPIASKLLQAPVRPSVPKQPPVAAEAVAKSQTRPPQDHQQKVANPTELIHPSIPIYLERDRGELGPYSQEELIKLGTNGKIRQTDQLKINQERELQSATLYANLFQDGRVNRCGNQVIMTQASALPDICLKTGEEVALPKKQTLVWFGGINQVLFGGMTQGFYVLLVLFGVIGLVYQGEDTNQVDSLLEQNNASRWERNAAKGAERTPAFVLLLVGFVGFFRYSKRKQKFMLGYGRSASFCQKQRTRLLISWLILLCGFLLCGFSERLVPFLNVILLWLGICTVITCIVLIYKFTHPIKITNMTDKYLCFKGANESFLQQLEKISPEEKDSLLKEDKKQT